MHASTSLSPFGQYGPTVVQTTRALAASSFGSLASATTIGTSRPSASSFSRERPAMPTVTSSGLCATRYSATNRPTNPVAPNTTMSSIAPGPYRLAGVPDPLRDLERQVEQGSLFTQAEMTKQAARASESEALLNGLVGLLVRHKVVDADELM